MKTVRNEKIILSFINENFGHIDAKVLSVRFNVSQEQAKMYLEKYWREYYEKGWLLDGKKKIENTNRNTKRNNKKNTRTTTK